MIVREVLAQDLAKMSFAQNDDVIRALSSHGSDAPFAVRILPGRMRTDRPVRDPHAINSTDEVVSIDPVVVANQVFWLGTIAWERFGHLASSPLCSGVRRDVEVHDLPTLVRH